MPWPQILLLISASLSAAAGVLLVLGGEAVGYVVVLVSVGLGAFVLNEMIRHPDRRD
jgi:hypothetical protein